MELGLARKRLAKERVYSLLEAVREKLLSERRASARVMEENKALLQKVDALEREVRHLRQLLMQRPDLPVVAPTAASPPVSGTAPPSGVDATSAVFASSGSSGGLARSTGSILLPAAPTHSAASMLAAQSGLLQSGAGRPTRSVLAPASEQQPPHTEPAYDRAASTHPHQNPLLSPPLRPAPAQPLLAASEIAARPSGGVKPAAGVLGTKSTRAVRASSDSVLRGDERDAGRLKEEEEEEDGEVFLDAHRADERRMLPAERSQAGTASGGGVPPRYAGASLLAAEDESAPTPEADTPLRAPTQARMREEGAEENEHEPTDGPSLFSAVSPDPEPSPAPATAAAAAAAAGASQRAGKPLGGLLDDEEEEEAYLRTERRRFAPVPNALLDGGDGYDTGGAGDAPVRAALELSADDDDEADDTLITGGSSTHRLAGRSGGLSSLLQPDAPLPSQRVTLAARGRKAGSSSNALLTDSVSGLAPQLPPRLDSTDLTVAKPSTGAAYGYNALLVGATGGAAGAAGLGARTAAGAAPAPAPALSSAHSRPPIQLGTGARLTAADLSASASSVTTVLGPGAATLTGAGSGAAGAATPSAGAQLLLRGAGDAAGSGAGAAVDVPEWVRVRMAQGAAASGAVRLRVASGTEALSA